MTESREISLVSIIKEIACRWRMLLLLLLAGLAAGTLMGLLRKDTAQESLKELEAAELTILSKEKVAVLDTMEQQYQAALEQLEASPLMSMDEENAWVGNLWYTAEDSKMAVKIMAESLFSDSNLDKFSDIIENVTKETLPDILRISAESEQGICVSLFFSDEASGQLLMNLVKETLQNEKALDDIGVGFLYEGGGKAAQELQSLRNLKINGILNLEMEIKTYKDKLTEKEKTYYQSRERVEEQQEYQDNMAAPSSGGRKLSIKLILLGGAAGIFICVCYIAFCYLINNKVKAEDDLKELFGIMEFQIIFRERRKQTVLDKSLLRYKCMVSKITSVQEGVDIAGTELLSVMEHGEKQTVAVWEFINEEETGDIALAVTEKIMAAGKEYTAENFPMESSEKMERLLSVKTAVILLQENRVSYHELSRAIEYLRQLEIDIAGAVKIV